MGEAAVYQLLKDSTVVSAKTSQKILICQYLLLSSRKSKNKLAISREHHIARRKVPTSRKKYQRITKMMNMLVECLDNGI